MKSITSLPCDLCKVEETRSVLYRHSDWLLFRDMHPLCAGHLLLVAQRHVLSFSHLSAFTPTQAFFERIVPIYERQFGGMIIYEHGNSRENMTMHRSVDHAHIHILPWHPRYNKQHMLQAMAMHDQVATTFDAALAPLCGQSYHALSWDDRTFAISKINLPSQAFRRTYADIVGLPSWDWKNADAPFLAKDGERDWAELNRQFACL